MTVAIIVNKVNTKRQNLQRREDMVCCGRFEEARTEHLRHHCLPVNNHRRELPVTNEFRFLVRLPHAVGDELQLLQYVVQILVRTAGGCILLLDRSKTRKAAAWTTRRT